MQEVVLKKVKLTVLEQGLRIRRRCGPVPGAERGSVEMLLLLLNGERIFDRTKLDRIASFFVELLNRRYGNDARDDGDNVAGMMRRLARMSRTVSRLRTDNLRKRRRHQFAVRQ